MKRKGIELPINVLVIIAVAVIVLLGIIALYFGGFIGPAGAMSSEGAKVKYCGVLMKDLHGCSTVDPDTILITDFDANDDGTCCDANDNLGALTRTFYGATDAISSRAVCGCSA